MEFISGVWYFKDERYCALPAAFTVDASLVHSVQHRREGRGADLTSPSLLGRRILTPFHLPQHNPRSERRVSHKHKPPVDAELVMRCGFSVRTPGPRLQTAHGTAEALHWPVS